MGAKSGATAPRIELQIRQDGKGVVRVQLGDGRHSVGRDQQADVRLPSEHVSRQHFDLVVIGDEVQVPDAGSRNGIKVQGKKVRQAVLAPGEIVAVPHFEMRFKWLPAAVAESAAPHKRKDTIGGGWDDYLEDDAQESRARRRKTDELPPITDDERTPPPQAAPSRRPSEAARRPEVSAPGPRLSQRVVVSGPLDDDEDPEESLPAPGPPLSDLLRAESNALLGGGKEPRWAEVIESLGSDVVEMSLVAPGDAHWWGGKPFFASLATPGEDQFPLVSCLASGRAHLSVPDNGYWRVTGRLEEPVKRGRFLRWELSGSGPVELRYGPHTLHVRWVTPPPAPEPVESSRAMPVLLAVAALVSMALHGGAVALPGKPRVPPRMVIESYADVTLDVPPPKPPEPQVIPEVERTPEPPKPKPKPINHPPEAEPSHARPPKGAPDAPKTAVAPPPEPSRRPQYTPRKVEGPLLDSEEPAGGGDSAPAPKSVGVADFKVQGTLGHLPELKLSKGQGRGAGREVFRGQRMKGASFKNLNLVGIGPPGALDGEAVSRELNRHARSVEACYTKVRENSPNAEGRVDLNLTVDAEGKVTAVRVVRDDLGSATMIQCLKKVARGMTFPAPKGGEAWITQPFTFRPDRL